MGIFSRRDKYGFDKNGIHKVTGTKLDKQGYDQDGFNVLDPANVINRITGTKFDERGFNKDGIHNVTGTKWGKWGVARSGETNWNKEGIHRESPSIDIESHISGNPPTFDQNGIHRGTGTRYDKEGYDKKGYDKNGFDRNGYDIEGYDKEGYDKEGVHCETKVGWKLNTGFRTLHAESKKAYRHIGYNDDGFDENGFTTSGIHQTTGTKYDLDGNDQHGFDEKGIHKVTKTKFDEEGFDSDGIHKVTKTKFDEDGYDKDGHWEHDEILNILEETMALHTSSIKSLSYLDNREFTIIGVERKDHDENKGIKITTKEDFDIEGKKINKFHTTRQAIVRKFLNDTGEPTDLFNAINQPDNSLKVKIFMRKSASDEDYFDLDQC